MSKDFSYRELCGGLYRTERLVWMLDYAMMLESEHSDQPKNTPVSLIEKPCAEFEVLVDRYLAEHREELIPLWLECMKCGARYSAAIGPKACVRKVPGPLSRDEGYRELAEMLAISPFEPPETCGGELRVVRDECSEEYLRERADSAVARQLSPVALKRFLSAWVAACACSGTYGDEVVLPLAEVLSYLQRMIEDEVDRLLLELGDASVTGGRRNFLPRGNTLRKKHQDYLDARDKFISWHNRLCCQAGQDREFIAADEEPRSPSRFPAAIALSVGQRGATSKEAPSGPMKEPDASAVADPAADPGLIHLSAGAAFYNIPKATLCKRAKKSPVKFGYLWSTVYKGRRYFRKDDLQRLSRSRTKLPLKRFPSRPR